MRIDFRVAIAVARVTEIIEINPKIIETITGIVGIVPLVMSSVTIPAIAIRHKMLMKRATLLNASLNLNFLDDLLLTVRLVCR